MCCCGGSRAFLPILSSRRMRQHVNPLSKAYNDYQHQNTLPSLSDWKCWYPRLDNLTPIPLHLDLGCHKGVYIQRLKKVWPQRIAFLGVDLRWEWIEMAKQRQVRDDSHHHFLALNVNSPVLDRVLAARPENILLKSVSALFSDPWFKRRHMKRRMVTVDLLKMLHRYLEESGVFIVKSDRTEVMHHVSEIVQQLPQYFVVEHSSAEVSRIQLLDDLLKRTKNDVFLTTLLETPTERESVCRDQLQPIYAAVYRKRS
jgi:tRNA (guanine-N7-)-methyltransferase